MLSAAAKPQQSLLFARSHCCRTRSIAVPAAASRRSSSVATLASIMGEKKDNAAQRGLSGEALLTFAAGVVLGYALRAIGAVKGSQRGASKSTSTSSSSGSAAKQKAAPTQGSVPPQWRTMPFKMVLCVNNGLGMGKGKIGAQCAHAAVGVIDKYASRNQELFRLWEMQGQPKIAVKVKDTSELAELTHAAKSAGLPLYLVHDAGRTQVAAGSQTVLAVGPGPAALIDQVTGHLPLL